MMGPRVEGKHDTCISCDWLVCFHRTRRVSFFPVSCSSGYVCCSGVITWLGTWKGLSTVPPSGPTSDDAVDDDGGSPVVCMLDYNGSGTEGDINVRGKVVSSTAVYTSSGTARLYTGSCLQASVTGIPVGQSTGVQIGTRGDEMGRFFRGVIGEVIVFPRSLNDSEVSLIQSYLAAQWPLPPERCSSAGPNGFVVSQMYAVTRYTQAVQSRNTLWPIKFNGMAFVANMDDGAGGPDFKKWGCVPPFSSLSSPSPLPLSPFPPHFPPPRDSFAPAVRRTGGKTCGCRMVPC